MASARLPTSASSSRPSRGTENTCLTPNLSLRNPAANTPGFPHSVNTNHLNTTSSLSTTSADNGFFPFDSVPYPKFLNPTRAELQAKWFWLELTHYERLKEGIQSGGSDISSRWARCNGEEYVPRNRYINVDPYQANRVKLQVPEGQLDYINASPILLESTSAGTVLRYIATQGPKADGWSHIWRMIWKENTSSAVVVMLTRTHEANREKCFPYYPKSLLNPNMRVNEQDEFGDGLAHDLHLTSLTHDERTRTNVREIDMKMDNGEESKKIWHLLFAGWPDSSIPQGADRAAMMQLLSMSRAKNSDNSTNPRIIHCSAGIGRTGTFIVLDWLMQELEEGSLDDVPEANDPIMNVIEKLREQRAGMVQSTNQFVFIYDVIREQWRERWIRQHGDEASSSNMSSIQSS